MKNIVLFMLCIVTMFITVRNAASEPKQASFVWKDELCEYEGFFDSAKTAKQQIQNACLLAGGEEFNINNYPAVFKLEDIKRLNINAFEKEYSDKKKRLSNMELPKDKIWETFRQEKLRELEQVYKLYKIEYEAYLNNNMEALRKFDKTDECLTYYSNALINGGDSLLAAWKRLTEEQASQNAYPEEIRVAYNEQRKSVNKFQYAKVYLLTFGWGNCAVKYIAWFDNSKASKEFKKLFTSIKEIQCEYP